MSSQNQFGTVWFDIQYVFVICEIRPKAPRGLKYNVFEIGPGDGLRLPGPRVLHGFLKILEIALACRSTRAVTTQR